MSRKAAVVTTPAPNPQMVQTRAEGMQIVSPLRPLVVRLKIVDDASYLDADTLLGRIKNARKLWGTKVNPIRDPIDRAIKELKSSLDGVKALDTEVDGPLEVMERQVKDQMRDYKLEEARQAQLQEQERQRQAEQLRLQAAKVRVQESSAVTTQMKAKLAQKRAELDAQADVVEEQTTTEVKGSMSTSRTVEKVRIADLAAFLQALTAYTPRAGVWEMGKPPIDLLTLHTKRDGTTTGEGSAVEKIEAEIAKIHSLTPGIVASWPGVEVYDDIIIAGR